MAISVPQPTLTQEGATGDRLTAAKPVALACGPVTFPDGSELTIDKSPVKFGYLLQRGTAGSGEVWDAKAKAWVPEASAPDPEPLFFKDGRWQAVIVGVGQKDAAGQERIATNPATGVPRYSVRCFFAAADATGAQHEGASPSSASVALLPPGADVRAGLRLDPEKPPDANKVEMFLAGATGDVGTVTLERSSSGAVLNVVAAGATIAIDAGGGIAIKPAAGQRVEIDGDLAVSHSIKLAGHEVATT